MDKWDEMINRVKQGILAEEPDAALAGALELFAEFGRVVERMGAGIDRIAKAFEPDIITDEPVPMEHDL